MKDAQRINCITQRPTITRLNATLFNFNGYRNCQLWRSQDDQGSQQSIGSDLPSILKGFTPVEVITNEQAPRGSQKSYTQVERNHALIPDRVQCSTKTRLELVRVWLVATTAESKLIHAKLAIISDLQALKHEAPWTGIQNHQAVDEAH